LIFKAAKKFKTKASFQNFLHPILLDIDDSFSVMMMVFVQKGFSMLDSVSAPPGYVASILQIKRMKKG